MSDILDDLLIAGPPGMRKVSANMRLTYSRDLTIADLQELAKPQGTTPSLLKSIRHSHHVAAKLLADGLPMTEISQISGFSLSRLSILSKDPAMQELISYYQKMKEDIYVDVHARLAQVGLDALSEIQRRIDEEPDSFKAEELTKVLTAVMDRAGYGPQSAVRISGGIAVLTDETLRRIKDEAQSRRAGSIHALPDHSRTPDGDPNGSAGPLCEEEKGKGQQGERVELREEVHTVSDEGGEWAA